MYLASLGYVGVGAAAPDDWSDFATRMLGLMEVERTNGTRAFRMDDRKQRLVVEREETAGLGFMGWEVRAPGDLDRLAAHLDAHDIPVAQGSRALADQRHVSDLIVFHDPAGNRLEAFHSPHVADAPFRPGRNITGFVTGPTGMGHVVLTVADVAALLPFYRDVLGFGVSDYGLSPMPMYFFHLNPRHHTFAILQTGRAGFHHLMIELGSLDDVGQGYDLALDREDTKIAYTLGRHTNDHVTSFYATTPSDFFVEYGWGCLHIDPATWEPVETTCGPSFWGHDRPLSPEPLRNDFRDMRLRAAEQGLRAPYDASRITCPWLDSVRR